jgi:hypothetical protein
MRRMMRFVWSRLRGTELVVWGLLYVVAAGVEGLGALMKGAAQDRAELGVVPALELLGPIVPNQTPRHQSRAALVAGKRLRKVRLRGGAGRHRRSNDHWRWRQLGRTSGNGQDGQGSGDAPRSHPRRLPATYERCAARLALVAAA